MKRLASCWWIVLFSGNCGGFRKEEDVSANNSKVSEVLHCGILFHLVDEQRNVLSEQYSFQAVVKTETGSGGRSTFVVHLKGRTSQGYPVPLDRVLFLDADMKDDLAVAIGCGPNGQELEDEVGVASLSLGERGCSLLDVGWKQPLLEQQCFCQAFRPSLLADPRDFRMHKPNATLGSG